MAWSYAATPDLAAADFKPERRLNRGLRAGSASVAYSRKQQHPIAVRFNRT